MKEQLEAKRNMLKSLKKQMSKDDDMGLPKVLGAKHQVTVAADSPKNLKKGLSKAEEILEKRKGMLGMGEVDDLSEKESEEEYDEEMMEDEEETEDKKEEMSKEDLQAKIEEYKSMLEKMD